MSYTMPCSMMAIEVSLDIRDESRRRSSGARPFRGFARLLGETRPTREAVPTRETNPTGEARPTEGGEVRCGRRSPQEERRMESESIRTATSRPGRGGRGDPPGPAGPSSPREPPPPPNLAALSEPDRLRRHLRGSGGGPGLPAPDVRRRALPGSEPTGDGAARVRRLHPTGTLPAGSRGLRTSGSRGSFLPYGSVIQVLRLGSPRLASGLPCSVHAPARFPWP